MLVEGVAVKGVYRQKMGLGLSRRGSEFFVLGGVWQRWGEGGICGVNFFHSVGLGVWVGYCYVQQA